MSRLLNQLFIPVIAGKKAAVPWYLAGGIPVAGCIGAYQAEGANSQWASYFNLNNVGFKTLYRIGTEPTWNVVTGWGNTAEKYLATEIPPAASPNFSVIVKFSDVAADGCLFGASLGNNFAINPYNSTTPFRILYNYVTAKAPGMAGGVVAIAGINGFRDGVFDTEISAYDGNARNNYIFARNAGYNASGVVGNIQAIAFYNIDISAYVPVVTAAMNALPTLAAPPLADTMVAFGDSITVGSGATYASNRWADIVAASKRYYLRNSGLSGTVLQDTIQNTVTSIGANAAGCGRGTYDVRVTAYHPGHVVILYGLNDLRLNDVAFTDALFQNDLGEIIDAIVADGTPAANIVIGSPPYIPEASYALNSPWTGGTRIKHASYTAACAAVAAAKGTKYADVYQYMTDNGGDALIGADNLHPNDNGHAAIATCILAAMNA